ncbi:MAG: hypothetical protein KGJ57_21615 [Sphingomonadales bacterium]|nr:hypothetical protein [Sphingomonadales bacterium]MDE2171991.1 hypothetical protein [Sphingomonadales bacterium]
MAICGLSRSCSEWRHTTNEHPTEGWVTYRFHPRFGEKVEIRRRLRYGGVEYVVVLQPDGSFASLPAWMTEPAASDFAIGSGSLRFPLDILRAMRAEVDALLGSLLSDSTTKAGDYGAQNRNPSTRSVRRKATASDTLPEAHDRTEGLSGMPDARDRADVGQSRKRGG